MKTIIIAALSENRVIGRDNAIPWHYPADMRHFRRVTRGHAVVAGRKTYETFQTRPLPQRRNFVLTRNPAWLSSLAVAEGPRWLSARVWPRFCSAPALVIVKNSSCSGVPKSMSRRPAGPWESVSRVDEMILTHLPIEVEGDAYFPADSTGTKANGRGYSMKAQRRRVGLCDVSPLLSWDFHLKPLRKGRLCFSS